MSSWQLDNADELAAAHKYTFYKPSRALIAKVQPGETVKLIFRFTNDKPEAPGAERIWVRVDAVHPDGRFTGRLDNEPEWIDDLKRGDPVSFDASHIIATAHDDPDNLVARYAKRCFVTHRILTDRAQVGYLYREPPDEDNDSGWRFTANDETDAYMDDPENSAYVSVGAVLAVDDSFIQLLKAPSGSAFFRDHRTGKFEPLTDED